jgi:HEAT repeat protein
MEDTAKKKFTRELLGGWIKRSDGSTAYQTLSLAMRFDLKEGLVPAVKLLENPGNPASFRQNAIVAIAKLGDDSHTKLLESLLEDESKYTARKINNVNYETQIRDVALAALVIMKKQDPKKFGFDRIQQNPTSVFSTSTVGFENDEKRNKALAKWKEFKSAQKTK